VEKGCFAGSCDNVSCDRDVDDDDNLAPFTCDQCGTTCYLCDSGHPEICGSEDLLTCDVDGCTHECCENCREVCAGCQEVVCDSCMENSLHDCEADGNEESDEDDMEESKKKKESEDEDDTPKKTKKKAVVASSSSS
jgi:hypothetical protein